MRCKLAFVCVVIITNAAGTGWANDWLTYHNDRYGTTIDYPNVFKMQRPPDSDDGREFKSADAADFIVDASYTDFNLAQYRDFIMKNLDAGAVVTYQAQGDDWFVLSGTKGDKIFYERHLLCLPPPRTAFQNRFISPSLM